MHNTIRLVIGIGNLGTGYKHEFYISFFKIIYRLIIKSTLHRYKKEIYFSVLKSADSAENYPKAIVRVTLCKKNDS